MILDPIAGGRAILADYRMLGWVAARIPHLGAGYQWTLAHALGVVKDGRILAGMVVHDYNPNYRNCQISMAADDPKWATRSTIAALLAYPFGQLQVNRITTVIASRNTRAIRFNLGIGFGQEGRSPDGFGDDDALIFGLLRASAPNWMGLAPQANNA